jgi:hypothetical protein
VPHSLGPYKSGWTWWRGPGFPSSRRLSARAGKTRWCGLSVLHNSKLFFPTRSCLLPKGSVFLIDRMPCKLSAFFNLSFEERLQRSNA